MTSFIWSLFYFKGLEGGSSEENDVGGPHSLEARQSAEGDTVMSPVPGDGGGGGDGSSGHGRSVTTLIGYYNFPP